MSEWQVEMLWRCTSCGERNRGRELTCGRCGSPKDGNETYEMPSDVSERAAVRDPTLLRVAHAGANWSCAYCGSDVRRLDGACGRCGAGEVPQYVQPARPVPQSRSIVPFVLAAVAVLFVGTCAFAMVYRRRPPPPVHAAAPEPPAFVDVRAEVVAAVWKRTVTVERHQLWPFEGFDKPADAIEVKELGPRVHHYDSVLDGYDTQTWTEKVQDGYDTQSYPTTEACGQTCVPRPQNCSPVCTPNKNGFATCKNVCTGGGQSCSTKYCTVQRTKQVPRYKDVTRSKQVPRYRKEPRSASYYSWRAIAWRPVRTLAKEGTTEAPVWPSDDELALTKDERSSRLESYTITWAYTLDGHRDELTRTFSRDTEFLGAPLGSKRLVRVHRYGAVELIGDAG